MLKLHDLPQFLITRIERREENVILRGTLIGGQAENGRAWLYVSRESSIIGNLEAEVPDATAFTAPRWAMNDAAQVGVTLPILSGGWNANQVARVLDERHIWHRRRFVANDAVEFLRPGVSPGWVGTVESGRPLPADAEVRGIRQGGWDHEHCDLCWKTIGSGGEDFGYVDADNCWLCENCFHAYAEKHDLSFLRKKSQI